MSSNLFSRLLPSQSGQPSIYEAIKEEDRPGARLNLDLDDTALDERNLEERFQDQDLDQLLAEAAESQTTNEHTAFLGQYSRHRSPHDPVPASRTQSRPKWMQSGRRRAPRSEEDDRVPESLILEHNSPIDGRRKLYKDEEEDPTLPAPVPGPASKSTQVKWDTARANQRLYDEGNTTATHPLPPDASRYLVSGPEERALWRWTNVENLDNFLHDVYEYYRGKGIWSIILSRILGLLNSAFVVGFAVFLTSCVDYRQVYKSNRLSEVIVPQCSRHMSGFNSMLIWIFSLLWFLKLFQYVVDVPRLRHLQEFFFYLLDISDQDMQTISWQEIVGKLMDLRDSNPRTAQNLTPQARKFIGEQSKQRMDAHDIANRLMRRENYLIALFNKDVLDLTLPIPYLRNRQLFSRTLEWNINLCVMDFVFNSQGQVQQLFLRDAHRQGLIDALRRRFMFAGFMNVICAPFIVTYLVTVYFLRYFTEFQKNPSSIGSRAYTPLAEWKFREFNELWHLFERRANMSYPFASRYLDQFPKDKTVQVARFVAFVSGALAAVLFVTTLLDPAFEITPQKSALFYATIFTGAWVIARGMVPEETEVFDPEYEIRQVIHFTHYQPGHWQGRLHSDDVRREFSTLYQLKVMNFLEEILSIVFTPFVLWFSLPNCSDRLVDFFREFTVHVDGLGYVCSFALFDFKKGGNAPAAASTANDKTDARADYYSTKDGKMMASYYNFLESYATRTGRVSRRQQFNPPPAFPGLASGNARASSTQVDLPSNKSRLNNTTSRSNMARSSSPPESLLLDPHHQPSVSMSRRQPPSSSKFLSQQPLEEFDEEDEDRATHSPQAPITSSGIIEEDSHLGDSWKTTKAAVDDTNVDRSTEEPGGQGAGVLGLLYQFQKAQTDGRAPGVSM